MSSKVLQLQVPSEIEEKLTAQHLTVALEEQAVKVPEVGSSQSEALAPGGTLHTSSHRHDVSGCITIPSAVQKPSH